MMSLAPRAIFREKSVPFFLRSPPPTLSGFITFYALKGDTRQTWDMQEADRAIGCLTASDQPEMHAAMTTVSIVKFAKRQHQTAMVTNMRRARSDVLHHRCKRI